MPNMPRALAVAALFAISGIASAATFNFSYTYSSSGGGHVMSGSLAGDRNDNGTPVDLTDDFVTSPAVLSAAFNGLPMISSPLMFRTYDDTGMHDVVPNVYFNVTGNNFIISPCAATQCLVDAYGNPAVTVDVFFLRSSASPGAQYYSELNSLVAYNDTSSSAGTWLLTEVSAVPEPSSYAMFASAMAGLWAVRRHRRA